MGLRDLREAQVLTQRELGRRAKVSNKTIVSIERGLAPPRMATIRKLAGALGLTPQQLARELRRERGSDADDGR